jgi:hypothetical protein
MMALCLGVQLTAQISIVLGSQDDFTELHWPILLRRDFPVIILLINEGYLGAFFLVLIWMRSFMEFLLG